MGYRILWLPWEWPQGPPIRNQGRGHFSPHVAIQHFLLGIFRDHMKKISQKSKNWSKISGYQKNVKIEISHHLDKRKIGITRLILKIENSNFTCKPNFDSRKNHILATRSKDQFLRLKYDIFLKKSYGCTFLGGQQGGKK